MPMSVCATFLRYPRLVRKRLFARTSTLNDSGVMLPPSKAALLHGELGPEQERAILWTQHYVCVDLPESTHDSVTVLALLRCCFLAFLGGACFG